VIFTQRADRARQIAAGVDRESEKEKEREREREREREKCAPPH